MRKRQIDVKRLTYGGLLVALIAVLTAFVKVPLVVGFAHVGDVAVVLSGVVLGPYGAIPAALGSALGDIIAGYNWYAPFSALIKGLMALFVGLYVVAENRVTLKNVLVLAGVFLFMPLAYFPVDCALYTPDAAVASVIGNCFQALVGFALGLALLTVGNRIPKKRK